MTQPEPHETARAADLIRRVEDEIGVIYLSGARAVRETLVAILAGGHALLEGVPGIAKTTLVKTIASTLGISVRRIQFTPDLLPADITGTYVLTPADGSFRLRPGPIFTHVVIADEINRAPAKTQSALLEAMQERQVTLEGDRYELPAPFIVLATQNPIELEGTYTLPEAQLDRFLLRVQMGYPSPEEEVAMLEVHGGRGPAAPKSVLTLDQVLELQALARRVFVGRDVLRYAVELARATRADPRVALGASPRATLALVAAARAAALASGRGYVTPDDLQSLLHPAFGHRILVRGQYEPKIAGEVIDAAVRTVPFQRAKVD